jgi:hypothetical protein
MKMYRPTNITATGTAVPVLPFVNTTSTTSVTGGTTATITPTSMVGITPYMFLLAYGGSGTAEIVQVTSAFDFTATTFKAYFANAHSGTWNIVSQKPTEIGAITINKVGTTTVLSLYDGAPALAGGSWGDQGRSLGVYSIASANVFFPPVGKIYNTLFYTITGSGFDITLWTLPHEG